jgi:DNA-directed RNA polymerase subunit RPC12/RpoP
VSYVICRKCCSRIQLDVRLRSLAPIMFVATCPSCGFRGTYSYVDIVEEGVYRARCEVCGVHLFSFRPGPARCPVCNSRYLVAPGGWQLLERGEPKPDPAWELATAGMLAGGIAGAREGRNPVEKIEGIVSGSVSGLFLGGLLGSFIKTLFRSEREVVYEQQQGG